MKKKCKICGEEFEKVYANHKICSKDCRKKARCQRSKRWREKNPKKVKEMCKDYYEKDPVKAGARCRAWVRKNKNRVNLKRRENYQKHRENRLINIKDRKIIKKDKCKDCDSKEKLEIHHISYKPSITEVLCRRCHYKKHGRRIIKT